MASTSGITWRHDVWPFLRAGLYAALASSVVGAVASGSELTLDNLIVGFHEMAAGNMKMGDLLWGLLGGVASLLVALVLAPFVAVPLCMVAAIASYPLAGRLRLMNRWIFAAIGFVSGSFIWFCMWGTAPTMNLYFESWFSMLAIGGLAGAAGGLAFARHFPKG